MSEVIISQEFDNEIKKISAETMDGINNSIANSIKNIRNSYGNELKEIIENLDFENDKSELIGSFIKAAYSKSPNEQNLELKTIGDSLSLDDQTFNKLDTTLKGLYNMSHSVEEAFNEANKIKDEAFENINQRSRDKKLEKNEVIEKEHEIDLEISEDNYPSLGGM